MNKPKFKSLKIISADFLSILKKIVVNNIKRLFGSNSLYRQINKLLSPNSRIWKSLKILTDITSKPPERTLSWEITDIERDCRILDINIITDKLIRLRVDIYFCSWRFSVLR
jgi:hypothetical protein